MSSDPLPQPGSTPDPVFGSTPDPVVPTPLPPSAHTSDPTLPLSSVQPSETDSGLAPNLAATLAVLLAPISGIVFLFLEKRNRYVRFWAMQSVFFGAGVFVFAIVSSIIHAVLASIFGLLGFLWILVSMVVHLGFLVAWIVMLFQAFNDKEWELPVLGSLARQQLAKTPLP